MNHGHECGQLVMIDEEGRARERPSLLAWLNFNNVLPTTEPDLQRLFCQETDISSDTPAAQVFVPILFRLQDKSLQNLYHHLLVCTSLLILPPFQHHISQQG